MITTTKNWFRSAISNEDGDVDPGYLAMAIGVCGWLLSTVSILIIGAGATSATKEHAATIQAIGISIGAVSGGFATMLGAVGLFRWGDKPHANTFTTSETKQQTSVTAPGAP